MKMAHLLGKGERRMARGEKVSWSELVRHAWYFERFREWLSEGLVTFTYLKKDNSIRDARGTLCPLLIPKDDRPKGTKPIVNCQLSIINYYDLDRKAWRSFDIRLFIGYVTIWELKESNKKKEPKKN